MAGQRLQIALVCLLVVIEVELGIIAMRLPMASVWAQTEEPIPVTIAWTPNQLNCPAPFPLRCVKVDQEGALVVSLSR
jgi:hypothetical protein